MAVAGVAWSQHVGVSAVHVQVDDGPWQQADLADAISIDTWRQWKYAWPAEKGQPHHPGAGDGRQGEGADLAVADVVPNGATGLHQISVVGRLAAPVASV